MTSGTSRDDGRASIDSFLTISTRTVEALDRTEIEGALDLLMSAWLQGKTIFVMGNGGSASTASHFAADLAKYTIDGDKKRFRVLCLTDNVASLSAWTNDSGWQSIFAEQLRPWQEPGDVLVGFSVHGGGGLGDAGPWSQNMVLAMKQAREAGMSIIGFSGYDGGAMGELADFCITVPALVDDLGTPVIESIHVLLHHLVVHELKQRVRAAEG